MEENEFSGMRPTESAAHEARHAIDEALTGAGIAFDPEFPLKGMPDYALSEAMFWGCTVAESGARKPKTVALISAAAGVSKQTARKWLRDSRGVRMRDLAAIVALDTELASGSRWPHSLIPDELAENESDAAQMSDTERTVRLSLVLRVAGASGNAVVALSKMLDHLDGRDALSLDPLTCNEAGDLRFGTADHEALFREMRTEKPRAVDTLMRWGREAAKAERARVEAVAARFVKKQCSSSDQEEEF